MNVLSVLPGGRGPGALVEHLPECVDSLMARGLGGGQGKRMGFVLVQALLTQVG